MKFFTKLQWGYLLPSIIFSFINFTGQAQCVAPLFPAPASILAAVPESAGYNMVYNLPIPSTNQVWTSQADVPYTVNNAAALGGIAFTRVAYYLKLESDLLGVQWVWVSMDAFTNDLGLISIPTGDILFQQQVTNMNVLNYAGVNKTGVSGNIEFWSNCYNPDNSAAIPNASGNSNDFGDMPTVGSNCYGSFQVHDFNAMESLLAYNGWAFAGFDAEDLGIGNFIYGPNPDWSFANNANFYSVKELYVLVNTAPYQPTCNNTSLSLDANGNATLLTASVTSETIGNCGIENISLSKENFTCADLGNNTVTLTFNINGNTSTCNATVTVMDEIKPVLTATGTSLTLGCDPSAADIEAALGTATAADNCGSPALQVITSAIITNGNNREQTRTWTATDASNNVATDSRTVKWTTNCTVDVPNIYPSDVSCNEFQNGATPLLKVCYKAEHRKVKKVSPKNFYYYSTVTAPSNLGFFNILTVDIVQTKSCANFKLYEIQGNQVRAYDENCKHVANGYEVTKGQGKVIIIGARPGKEYTIWVNYETKSLEGSTYSGNTAPVCSNSFSTRISAGLIGQSSVVPGSQGSILANPDCYDNPRDRDDDFSGTNPGSRDDDSKVLGKLEAVATPNPASGQFAIHIQGKGTTPVSVRVLDVMGKLVYSSNKVASNTILRLGENWHAGIYFVEIQQGEERKVMRLVKQ